MAKPVNIFLKERPVVLEGPLGIFRLPICFISTRQIAGFLAA